MAVLYPQPLHWVSSIDGKKKLEGSAKHRQLALHKALDMKQWEDSVNEIPFRSQNGSQSTL